MAINVFYLSEICAEIFVRTQTTETQNWRTQSAQPVWILTDSWHQFTESCATLQSHVELFSSTRDLTT